MNRITAQVCGAHLDVTFAPLARAQPAHAFKMRDGQSYRNLADMIADVMVPQLDDARSQTEHEHPALPCR